MRVVVPSTPSRTSARKGPVCLACSNTREFLIETPNGEEIVNARSLRGEVTIVACGKCRSRHSIVFALVD